MTTTGPRVDGTTPAVHDLTPDELAAWEALAAAATPGPWRIEEEQISYATSGYRLYDPANNCVAGNFDYEVGGICERGDAEFIAAARTDIPRLAAALRSAWAERDQYRAESERLGNFANERVQIITAAANARARIAEAHSKHVDEHGGTTGACNECNWNWPCPTYVWATTDRDPNGPWDPADDEESADV